MGSHKSEAFHRNKIEVLEQWLMAIEKVKEKAACRTIAICNQKGGVGKTVTAINLSAMLGVCGRRTLLIDLDPQGHSGLGLGLETESLSRSVYDVLVNGKCPIGETIVPLRRNLEILPSNIDLAGAELEMARLERRERRLKELIDDLRDHYEYVVIDCPPSVGILTINALVASKIVIVPVTPSLLSIHGLSKVIEVLDALRGVFFLDVRVFSLITFFEQQLKEAYLQQVKLEETFGQYLLKTVVRKNTKLNEATRKGVSIFEYDRHCPGSRDYFDLAKEIMSIELRSECGEKIQEELEFYSKTGPDEEEKTDEPEGSREWPITSSEDLKRSEEFEVTQEEKGSEVKTSINRMGMQRFGLLAVILIVLAGLFGVFFVIRDRGQRVETTRSEGEIDKTVLVREKPAYEKIEKKPGDVVSQSEERLPLPPVAGESETQRMRIEPSSTEALKTAETPLVASTVGETESWGKQIEGTEEEVATGKEREEPIIESFIVRGGYTVNLASFREKARADRYLEELKDQGLEAFEWEIDLPQKGRWYRVSTGNFSTPRQARFFARDLEHRGFKTFVAKLPSDQKPANPSELSAEEGSRSTNRDHGPPQIQDMRRLLRS